jgi:hypothetical protein
MGDSKPFVLVKFEYEDTSRFFIASRYEANIILNNNIGFRNPNDDIITINGPPPTNDDEFFVIVYNNPPPPPPPPGAGANRIRIIPLPPNDVPGGAPDAAATVEIMAGLQEPNELSLKELHKSYETLIANAKSNGIIQTKNIDNNNGGRHRSSSARKSSAKKRTSRRKFRSTKKRASRRYRHRRA